VFLRGRRDGAPLGNRENPQGGVRAITAMQWYRERSVYPDVKGNLK